MPKRNFQEKVLNKAKMNLYALFCFFFQLLIEKTVGLLTLANKKLVSYDVNLFKTCCCTWSLTVIFMRPFIS